MSSKKQDDRREKADLHALYVQSAARIESDFREARAASGEETGDAEGDESGGEYTAASAAIFRRHDVLAPPPAPGAGTSQNPDSIVDIVTFCEHEYYLYLRLTPWQELILRTFYLGTEGNYHLGLSDSRPESGCAGCVWSKNLECETEHAKARANKEYKTALRVLGPADSRCLSCVRFDPELRAGRYAEMRANAPKDGKAAGKSAAQIAAHESREIQDNFQSQMDLVMGVRDGQEDPTFAINPKVRENLVEKMGLKFQEMILVLGRRSGKALALDTPIITPEGWSTMGELRTGGFVFAPDGQPTRIVAVSEVMAENQCYRLAFSNGDVIVADAGHDWMVTDAKGRADAAAAGREPTPACADTRTIAAYFAAPPIHGAEYNYAILAAKFPAFGGGYHGGVSIVPDDLVGGGELVFITGAEKMDVPAAVRCIQVESPDHCYLAGRTMLTTHNSFLVSIIASYEAYKFLMMGHPQSRYPLKQWDEIMILNVALSESQARLAIFNKLREDVLASPFFAGYLGKVTQTEMYLLTPADQDENKRREKSGTPLLTGSIHIKSGNSNSTSQLGGTIAVIIIDEMAAMASPTADGGSTDELLYTMLKPSIATFGLDGKIICISNPLGPFGYFYKLYTGGIDDELTLVHQLPTWLTNPSIPNDFIESERRRDPKVFNFQYAAKFGGGGEQAWLPEEFVDYAFPAEPREASRRREYGEPLHRYYMHLDPAHSTDRYTLCIVHAEPIDGSENADGSPMSKVLVDHMHYWSAPSKGQPINVEEVEKYVLDVGRRFRVAKITYDQFWSSQSSIMKFTRAGFRCEMTPYVYQYQNTIYGELYDLFTSQRIEFYQLNTVYSGVELREVTLAHKEFANLQKKWNKGRPKIEAPHEGTDDFADCVAGAAYQAIKDRDFKRLPKPRLGMVGLPSPYSGMPRPSYGVKY